MAIVISGNGIDMGGNPVSNASQIDGVVINENNESVATENLVNTKTTLAEANSYDLGVGQTWQNVGTNRSFGVNYTNNTGKPIVVSVTVINTTTGSSYLMLYINGYPVIGVLGYGNTYTYSVNAIVPNGAVYNVPVDDYNLTQWYELR